MAVHTGRASLVVNTVNDGNPWATTANAVDGAYGSTPATYATWTSSVSAGQGNIQVGNFGLPGAILPTATVNSVTFTIRHLESTVARFSAVQFRAYAGATALGAANSPGTLATTAHNDTFTAPVTVAQLDSQLRVYVYVTRAAVTQSTVFSIDHVDCVVDYTPAHVAGRPNVWTGSAWVECPVKRWSGSVWEEVPMKWWNGSAWVSA